MLRGWGVPLAVFGLLLATLFMAAVVSRYQAHQARVRDALQRLESGTVRIGDALQHLRGVPLSKELRVALRAEVLARLQRMRRLHRRFPGIAERIATAERALQAEGPAAGGGVGPIETDQDFRRVIGALDALRNALDEAACVQPVPRDVRLIFRRELGERRAEAAARYHLVQARKYETAGNGSRARAHLTTLLQTLRQRGPATEFVRELYGQADAALTAFTGRQLGIAMGTPADAPAKAGRQSA